MKRKAQREEKKKLEQNEKSSIDFLDMQTSDASSSGDMTGLIPAAPVSDQELEAYGQLYSQRPIVKPDDDRDNC